jgi:CDP-paratose 2-epimerase
MKRMVITGGAGFVGSSLALLFKQHFSNLEILCFDNLSRRGSELNLPRLKAQGIQFIQGDVRNSEDFERIGKVDWLIECSAEPSVHAGYGESPRYLINTNLNGLINCLEHLRQHGGQCVFLSSSRVYPIGLLRSLPLQPSQHRFELTDGPFPEGVSQLGISEACSLEGPRSLYGTTKLSGELFIQEYCQTYGLQAIINRCGVLAGPWQMGKVDQGFMALWVAQHVFGHPLRYMGFGGEGLQVRDVLHVEDLFHLLRLQMAQVEAHSGVIYNVGGGHQNSTSLAELTERVSEITQRKIQIHSDPTTREADIPYYVTDITKVNQKTNWRPQYSLTHIVEGIFQWIEREKNQLKPIFDL